MQYKEMKHSLKKTRTTHSVSRLFGEVLSPELKRIVANEGRHYTQQRVLKVSGTFLSLFACLYLIEVDIQSAIGCWALKILGFSIFVGYVVGLTSLNSAQIRRVHRIKRLQAYDFDENDLHFDGQKNIIWPVALCFLSGVLSGALGIASGTILSPLYLSLGLLPSVMAATCSYISMVGSLSVSLQYMYRGQLNYKYLLLLSLFIWVSTLAGITQVNKLLKKTGRQSIIVAITAVVLLISFLVLPFKYAVH